jgi:hypothetical protein
MLRPWWQDWRGQTAVVVASGPSAGAACVELAEGRAKVIAVNSSWRLCRWADILLATDAAFWEVYKGVPEFAGLKLTGDDEAIKKFGKQYRIDLLKIDRSAVDQLVLDQPGVVASGNSGFTAVNLAAQFGASRILLVGFDCRIDQGLHWHGKHDDRLNNPDLGRVTRWAALMDRAAEPLAAAGIEVVNCSDASAITAFPKMTLQRALAQTL